MGAEADLNNLSAPEKVFVYIDYLDRQVNNGGFHQFFFNSTGEYAHEVLDAYEAIGAHKTADIIERAIKLFPVLPIPKDTLVRRTVMLDLTEEIEDAWNSLDDEFYKYEDDVLRLLIEFLRSNNK
nr:DMP19 family protein [Cesiribacter sp. SM1]